ncbi:MAG: protein kinase, partial [archaeon]|nr:protein kinase [archaeon]
AKWQQGCLAMLKAPQDLPSNGNNHTWCLIRKESMGQARVQVWGALLPQCTRLLHEVMEVFSVRLTEFYQLPHQVVCLAHPSGPVAQPDQGSRSLLVRCFFPLPDLQRSYLNGQTTVRCPCPDVPAILIKDLVPELFFVHLAHRVSNLSWSELKEIRELGSGAFGRVFLAEILSKDPLDASSLAGSSSNEGSSSPLASSSSLSIVRQSGLVAVKVLAGSSMSVDVNSLAEFCNEANIMGQMLHHPNILPLHGICLQPPAIVMEVACGGDLFQQLNDPFLVERAAYMLVRGLNTALSVDAMLRSRIQSQQLQAVFEARARLPHSMREAVESAVLRIYCQYHPGDRDRQAVLHDIDTAFKDSLTDPMAQHLHRVSVSEALQMDPADILAGLAVPRLQDGLDAEVVRLNEALNALRAALDASSDEVNLFRVSLDRGHQVFMAALETLSVGNNRNSERMHVEARDEFLSIVKDVTRAAVGWNWPLRLKLALDITRGMVFLHGQQPPIVHRDLKSPNVFLTYSILDAAQLDPDNLFRKPLAKVADFGLSIRQVSHAALNSTGSLLQSMNPTWAAPEVLMGHDYTAKADIYGLGMIFWEIVFLQMPFSESGLGNEKWSLLHTKIVQGCRPKLPESRDPLENSFLGLIDTMWHHEPQQRPEAEAVLGSLVELLRMAAPELTLLGPAGQQSAAGLGPVKPRSAYLIDLGCEFVEMETSSDCTSPSTFVLATPLQVLLPPALTDGVEERLSADGSVLTVRCLQCREFMSHEMIESHTCSAGTAGVSSASRHLSTFVVDNSAIAALQRLSLTTQQRALPSVLGTRPVWLPDAAVTRCPGCCSSFSLIRRKHHCRLCGGVFCSRCLPVSCLIPSLYRSTRVRLCVFCVRVRLGSLSPAEFGALPGCSSSDSSMRGRLSRRTNQAADRTTDRASSCAALTSSLRVVTSIHVPNILDGQIWVGFQDGTLACCEHARGANVPFVRCADIDLEGGSIDSISSNRALGFTTWSGARHGSLSVWDSIPRSPEYLRETNVLCGWVGLENRLIGQKRVWMCLELGCLRWYQSRFAGTPENQDPIDVCKDVRLIKLLKDGSSLKLELEGKGKLTLQAAKIAAADGEDSSSSPSLRQWAAAIKMIWLAREPSVRLLARRRLPAALLSSRATDSHCLTLTCDGFLTRWRVSNASEAVGGFQSNCLLEVMGQLSLGGPLETCPLSLTRYGPSHFLCASAQQLILLRSGKDDQPTTDSATHASLSQLGYPNRSIRCGSLVKPPADASGAARLEVWLVLDNHELIVGGFDAEGEEPLQTTAVPLGCGAIECITQISPSEVWAGVADGTLVAWDTSTRQRLPDPLLALPTPTPGAVIRQLAATMLTPDAGFVASQSGYVWLGRSDASLLGVYLSNDPEVDYH